MRDVYLQSGERCKLRLPGQRDQGKIVLFLNKSLNGKYLFQAEDNEREIFVCHDDSQFVVLPTKEQIKSAIDLCLDLGWKELFDELSEDLLHGNYNQ